MAGQDGTTRVGAGAVWGRLTRWECHPPGLTVYLRGEVREVRRWRMEVVRDGERDGEMVGW